ncbi:MAG: hypothetical protein MUC78_00835, partial [Bacteroidales bacterium]|nr:hypothetical protein [Bacteroidales bacterium]
MKNNYLLLVLLLIIFLPLEATEVIMTYPAPVGAVRSFDFTVLVNGREVDLYGSENRYGSTASFGYFDFEGTVTVDVIFHHAAPHSASLTILPESYGLKPVNVENGHIRFSLDKPANLSVIHCGDYNGRTLHLFAAPVEKEIPDRNDPNVIYFGPGYHEISKEQNRTITLKSNQTLYLEGGAYVVGVVRKVGPAWPARPCSSTTVHLTCPPMVCDGQYRVLVRPGRPADRARRLGLRRPGERGRPSGTRQHARVASGRRAAARCAHHLQGRRHPPDAGSGRA